MEENTKNYFKIQETAHTETGTIHHIAWEYYLPKYYFSELSKYARALDWFKLGLYSVRQEGKSTELYIDDRILKDFEEILKYIGRTYKY